MKRIILLIAAAMMVCYCNQIPSDKAPEEDEVDGWAAWEPYFFASFKYIIRVAHLRPKERANREVVIYFDDIKGVQRIEVPREKYDSIRIALGDTIPFLHSDADPPGIGCIHDYDEITLTSNSEYEGVPAGESLNSLVDFFYETPIPWLQTDRFVDSNGKVKHTYDPEYSRITCRMDELDPGDLNGCYYKCKLIFPTEPDPEQSFTLSFRGPVRKASTTFTVPVASSGY